MTKSKIANRKSKITEGEPLHRRTKRLKVLAAFAALCCLCAGARAQQSRATDVSAVPLSAAPYRVGEQLTYNVAFSNFPTAAHVQLRVNGRGQYFGREGFELHAHVETSGIVAAALYALNNTYTTYVEPSTGLPFRALQTVQEAGRTEETMRDSGGAFDFLSAVYRLRALPLAPGAIYTINVQHGGVVYPAEVRVTGRELVKTSVGSSNAVVAQVRVRSNEAADDYRIHLYFTDDEQHVPVLITARHRVGEIRAELASAELLTETQMPPGTSSPLVATLPQPGATPPPGPPGAAGPPAASPTPPRTSAAATALPFKPGEQLNFNFFLGAGTQPVGTGSFQVRARANYYGRDGLLLSAVLQSSGAGATLFPVSDQLNSYVDATTVHPFRAEQSLQEGPRRARWVVSTDQNGGVALFDDGTRLDIPVGTHDLLSVFYAIRSLDLSPGKRHAYSLIVNKRPRQLAVVPLRRGMIMLGAQKINAVEVALSTDDPKTVILNLRLWVSTDGRAIPLRLTADTPLGPVRADLAIIPTSLQ
jgi:hypothetical protein